MHCVKQVLYVFINYSSVCGIEEIKPVQKFVKQNFDWKI